MTRELYFKLCEYFEVYGKYYKTEHMNFIMQNIGRCVAEQTGPDIVMQVMSALNLLRTDKDFYLAVLALTKHIFDLKSDILEIGGGYYPALAKKIDEEQTKLQGGSITTYDPRLAVANLGHIKLHKEEFDKQSLNPYDLVVSAMPCDITSLIIERCNTAKKPFLLALCNCPPYPVSNFEASKKIANMWHEQLYYQAKSTLDEGAKLEMMDTLGEYTKSPVLIKTYRNR